MECWSDYPLESTTVVPLAEQMVALKAHSSAHQLVLLMEAQMEHMLDLKKARPSAIARDALLDNQSDD
jgi:hypothetical protein